MFASDTAFVVERDGDRHWKLTVPLVYHGKRDSFTVPAGYSTDFASVPKMLQWFAPSTGKYTLAAVLHDYLCDLLNDHGYAWLPNRYLRHDASPGLLEDLVTSRDVDGLFRRVMREQKVPAALRWFMWTGVRWGALFNRRRRPGILRDLPLMLVLSVLALPLVLPATVFIVTAYFLLYIYEGVADFFTGVRKGTE